MNPLSELKRKLFPKGIRRTLNNYRDRTFHRTSEKKLSTIFSRLGLERDSVICIHSMLSGLGYLVGGPQMVLRAVQNAAPESTLMMPTFPIPSSAVEYLASDPVYHIKNTPSQSGLLSETLRLMPGAKRSYHPTHPCVALGPKADLLIDGSEQSVTPFGDDSTYGRISRLDEAVLLLIHTNNTSIVHRIQEMVNMPNLFLDRAFAVKGYDANDKIVEYGLKVHTTVVPLYLVMPGADGAGREYVWYPDYVLLFPDYNRERILQKIKNNDTRDMLIKRHEYFIDSGVYKIVRYGTSEIATVRVKPWLERLCRDIGENLETFRDDYAYEKMKAVHEKGLLTKYE